MNRYANTDVVNDTLTNKRNYATTIFPSIPVTDGDIYIVSRDGDRLDILAHRFYNDSTLWWIIAVSNGFSDSFFIPPGVRLRIPSDIQAALSFVQTTNDVR